MVLILWPQVGLNSPPPSEFPPGSGLGFGLGLGKENFDRGEFTGGGIDQGEIFLVPWPTV